MNKKLISALAVAAGATMASSAFAVEEGKLLVWINGDKGYDGLQEVGNRFAADTGIEVKVEHPDNVTEKFQKEAAIGKGPDIFIWAHDRFGDWAKSGLIAPVEPSAATKKALVDQWGAVTYEGKVYGYPIAIEGPTLIYNKALVKKAPKSFDEIKKLSVDLKAQGKTPIVWDYNNTYFTYGVLTAQGGYAFEATDSGWNGKVTGVSKPGAVAGAATIKGLIDEGVMPAGADYGVMDAAFSKGEAAMIINGPWAWSAYEKSGIDFGLAPYPQVEGKVGKGFIGVLSAALNASSPNKDLVVEFMENYVLTEEGLKSINDDKPLGVVTHKKFMKKLISETKKEDKAAANRLKSASKIWNMAEPMPNIPEMAAFWSNMGPALTAITSGRQSPEDALNDAASRIVK